MADNDYVRGSMDVSNQKSTYHTVMKYGMEWGAPFSLALATFFTALLVGANLWLTLFIIFPAVLIGCHLFVKTFLSH